MQNKKTVRTTFKSSLKVVREKPIFNMLALTKKGGDIIFVNEEDIVYCKADRNNTIIYFADGVEISTPRLLKTVLDSLPHNSFHRIHNSFIVNVKYARQFVKKNYGGELVLIDGKKLPVSGKNRNYILKLFKVV